MNKSVVSSLASPLNYKGLSHLRYRGFNEDPVHKGAAVNGEKTVWYKVDKAAVIDRIGATKLLEAVSECFRNEGLTPDARVLAGTEEDKQYTLSFAFPKDQLDAVNAAVLKINQASRNLQQGMSRDCQGL